MSFVRRQKCVKWSIRLAGPGSDAAAANILGIDLAFDGKRGGILRLSIRTRIAIMRIITTRTLRRIRRVRQTVQRVRSKVVHQEIAVAVAVLVLGDFGPLGFVHRAGKTIIMCVNTRRTRLRCEWLLGVFDQKKTLRRYVRWALIVPLTHCWPPLLLLPDSLSGAMHITGVVWKEKRSSLMVLALNFIRKKYFLPFSSFFFLFWLNFNIFIVVFCLFFF